MRLTSPNTLWILFITDMSFETRLLWKVSKGNGNIQSVSDVEIWGKVQ
jgi:hypothetical protein